MMWRNPASMVSLGRNSPSADVRSMHLMLHSLDYLFHNPVNQWVEITTRSTVCFNPIWFTEHRVYELGIKALMILQSLSLTYSEICVIWAAKSLKILKITRTVINYPLNYAYPTKLYDKLAVYS